jgi:EAL domain-containing protein (putative c-di-GMP-specific phosphodiesterase class I)
MPLGKPARQVGTLSREIDESVAPPEPRGTVLVVDDELAITKIYRRLLGAAGFTVEIAINGREAVDQLGRCRFDAILSDIAMPELDGIGLLRAVRARDLDVPVILVSGNPSVETALAAVEYGALRYLCKPVDNDELLSVVERAVQLCRMARVKREALEHLGATSVQPGDRAGLEVAFSRALEGLWMAYQPIVRCASRRVFAYEALLRSSEKALPHPGAVIGAAERLGRLNELGRAVRTHVAVTVSKSPIPLVFVNLHTSDLLDDELYARESPLSRVASRVVLEITERASLDMVSDVQSRMARLRELGYRIAIDDIGAGYAGLTSIAQLQPEIMKIDMGLVRDVDVDSTRQKLVGAMVGLCKEMDVQVITEGVETRAERDALLRLGADLMQGYLFAKPDWPFPEAKL